MLRLDVASRIWSRLAMAKSLLALADPQLAGATPIPGDERGGDGEAPRSVQDKK
jgi:hypothetical protein